MDEVRKLVEFLLKDKFLIITYVEKPNGGFELKAEVDQVKLDECINRCEPLEESND